MMPKIVDNNGQYKITLPKELVEDKGWSGSTRIRFIEDKRGNVMLKVIRDE